MTEAFLRTLFANVPPGYIEIRLIEDKKGGAVVRREWYPSADALIGQLSALHKVSTEKHAAVFYGVMPRRNEGSGGSASTLPGLAAWADIDFKDLAGGEAEARDLLTRFPVTPSAAVASGHGLHVYWFLTEPAEPSVVSDLVARAAILLHGDHVSDPARLLRIPGTTNWKDISNPKVSTIEKLNVNAKYEVAELQAALAGVDPGDKTAVVPARGLKIAAELPEKVRVLLAKHARLAGLFNNKGKTATGDNGRPLDGSGSGYDFSFALALARHGVTDPSELASALWARPDEHAKLKGEDYVSYTVGKVLGIITRDNEASKKPAPPPPPTVTIDKMRVFIANPPLFEITLSGTTFQLGHEDLVSPHKFQLAYFAASLKLLTMPKQIDWNALVNGWIGAAERVETPPEASAEMSLREKVADIVKGLTITENAEDLDKGVALFDEEKGILFKTRAVMEILDRRKEPGASVKVVCAALEKLGYKALATRVPGVEKPIWLWRSETPPPVPGA